MNYKTIFQISRRETAGLVELNRGRPTKKYGKLLSKDVKLLSAGLVNMGEKMKNVNYSILVILVALLAIPFQSKAQDMNSNFGLSMGILGHIIANDGVYLQVNSGGCTQKRDIGFRVKANEPDLAEITFFRKLSDPCLAYFPNGIVLKFSFEELGLKPGMRLQIMNPIESPRILESDEN